MAETIQVKAKADMMAGARSTVMSVGRTKTMSGTVIRAGMRAPFSSALEARVWRNS